MQGLSLTFPCQSLKCYHCLLLIFLFNAKLSFQRVFFPENGNNKNFTWIQPWWLSLLIRQFLTFS